MSPRTVVLAVLAASTGCVLAESGELSIEPEGVLFLQSDPDGGERAFVFEVRSAARHVAIEVDGREVGTYPTGETLRLSPSVLGLHGRNEGPHRLFVSELDSAVQRTASRTIGYYTWAPDASVTPATTTALAEAPDPFVARITYRVPLVKELVTSSAAWLEVDGVRIGAKPRLLEDGRTIELRLPDAPAGHGLVAAVVSHGLFGLLPEESRGDRFEWRGALLRATIRSGDEPVSGTALFAVEVEAGSTFPASTELLAGAHVVATFVGPPPDGFWRASWDSRQVPDGTYALSLRATDGTVVLATAEPPAITVANAGTGLAACELAPTPALGMDCVRLVPGARETLVVSRQATLSFGAHEAYLSRQAGVYCPTWMYPVEPDVLEGPATVRVWASNDAGYEYETGCTLAFHAWTSAGWGDPVPGVAASGSATVVREWIPPVGAAEGPVTAVLAVDRAAEPKVRLWERPDAGGDWVAGPALNEETGSAASGLSGRHWVERVGAGPGRVHTFGSAALNLDAGQDSASIAWVPEGGQLWPVDAALAWSEAAPEGGRRIVTHGCALPRASPELIADHPAVLAPHALLETNPFQGQLMAWTETTPGGVAQLRVATVDGACAVHELPGAGNTDPAVGAHEPTVFGGAGVALVAWREGSTVYSRVLTPDGAGEAVVINADPTRPARSPRFEPLGGRWLYWIEETATGDAIRVRRYTGTEWKLYETAVNGPALGVVEGLRVERGTVSWVDGAGGVHVRFPNFP